MNGKGMTEDDIREAQQMIEDIVQQVNIITQANKALQEIAVKYQKFIVDHIAGVK